MKKYLICVTAVLLMCALTLGLAACGGDYFIKIRGFGYSGAHRVNVLGD